MPNKNKNLTINTQQRAPPAKSRSSSSSSSSTDIDEESLRVLQRFGSTPNLTVSDHNILSSQTNSDRTMSPFPSPGRGNNNNNNLVVGGRIAPVGKKSRRNGASKNKNGTTTTTTMQNSNQQLSSMTTASTDSFPQSGGVSGLPPLSISTIPRRGSAGSGTNPPSSPPSTLEKQTTSTPIGSIQEDNNNTNTPNIENDTKKKPSSRKHLLLQRRNTEKPSTLLQQGKKTKENNKPEYVVGNLVQTFENEDVEEEEEYEYEEGEEEQEEAEEVDEEDNEQQTQDKEKQPAAPIEVDDIDEEEEDDDDDDEEAEEFEEVEEEVDDDQEKEKTTTSNDNTSEPKKKKIIIVKKKKRVLIKKKPARDKQQQTNPGVLFVPRAPRNEKQLGTMTKRPYKNATRLKGPKWMYLWHCIPCRYGDNCVFRKKGLFCKRAHEQEELRCPQYALYGLCVHGSKCTLKHSLGTIDDAKRVWEIQRQKKIEDETRRLVMEKFNNETLLHQQQQQNSSNLMMPPTSPSTTSPTVKGSHKLDALPPLTMTVREQKDRLWKTAMCVRGDTCRAFKLGFWCRDCHDPQELRCKSFALFGVCFDSSRGCPLVHTYRTEKEELQRIRSQIEHARLNAPQSEEKITMLSPSNLSARLHQQQQDENNNASADQERDTEKDSETASTASKQSNATSNNNKKEKGGGGGGGGSHHHHHGGGGGHNQGRKINMQLGGGQAVPEHLKHASDVDALDDAFDLVSPSHQYNHHQKEQQQQQDLSSNNNNKKTNNKNKKSKTPKDPDDNYNYEDDGNNNNDEEEEYGSGTEEFLYSKHQKDTHHEVAEAPITPSNNKNKNKSVSSSTTTPKLSPSLSAQQHQIPNNNNNKIGRGFSKNNNNNNKNKSQDNNKKSPSPPNTNNEPTTKQNVVDSEKKDESNNTHTHHHRHQSDATKFLLRAERNLYKTEFCPSLHFCREYRNFAWCDDAHTLEEVRCPQFALTGKCPRGDSCPLTHTRETRAEAKDFCQKYRIQTLGLKAPKLRPEQMRKLPAPEVLTSDLAAKLSQMPESQRRLLLSNTAFCPLGVDCKLHAHGLPCGQCHEPNEMLCPYQMLYGTCILLATGQSCPRQHVPDREEESHVESETRKMFPENVQQRDPSTTTTKEEKQPEEKQQQQHNDEVNPNPSPSSLLPAPSNTPATKKGGGRVLDLTQKHFSAKTPPFAATSISQQLEQQAKLRKVASSYFFDEQTGEPMFYVDVPPSLTITEASPTSCSNSRNKQHQNNNNKTQNIFEDIGGDESLDSPISPPSATTNNNKNVFTSQSTKTTSPQLKGILHPPPVSPSTNSKHGRTLSNASSSTSNNNNNNQTSSRDRATVDSSKEPNMPHAWVDLLYKTRWCPFLATCRDYLGNDKWCFGAHVESELRCPQFALTEVLAQEQKNNNKNNKKDSSEIEIDPVYGACPRKESCPFVHSSGTSRDEKHRFMKGEDKKNNSKTSVAEKITTVSSSSKNSINVITSPVSPPSQEKKASPLEENTNKDDDEDEEEDFVEPSIPEALLTHFRSLRSTERRRLLFKTSICPLLAPRCEDCVAGRCFFASSVEEIRCPYFSIFGVCPKRACHWVHVSHEALGVYKPLYASAPNRSNPTSGSSTPALHPQQQNVSSSSPALSSTTHMRLDPPEFLWPATPQMTPQISSVKTQGEDTDETMSQLTL